MMKRCELDVDGGCVAYWIRRGKTAQWAIFLHGGGAGHESFVGQYDLFDEDWNLLLPDLRGSGQSGMKDKKPDFDDIVGDLAQIAQRHNICGAVVLGHSFGAAVAQELAFRHPDVARTLVLMGAYNHHRAFGRGLMDGVRVALTKAILKAAPWSLVAGLFARISTRDKPLRAYLRKSLIETGKENWESMGLSAFRNMHAVDRYEHPLPTLLIRGEFESPDFLDRIYADMRKVNSDTQVAVIAGAGHLAPQEKPAETNRVIAEFLDIPVQGAWAIGFEEAFRRLCSSAHGS